MKILFAAPVTFHKYTFFISQYVTGLAKAAKTLGHDVRLVQTTESIYNPIMWKSVENIFLEFRKRRKWLADIPHDLLLINQLYQEVRDYNPDLLFIHPLDTYYLPLIIDRIKQRGTTVITWLGVHPSKISTGIHRLLRSSDYTLIYDPTYIDYYNQELGIRNLRIVPLGCDTDYYESIVPDQSFIEENGVDVSFVGLFDEYREEYLRALSDFNLGIWSWNIDNYDTTLKKFHRGVAYGESLIKVFKSSKIVLNIHRDFEESGGNYRLFEIPACNAFQIVDEKRDIGKYFKVEKEVVTFKDKDDLRRKVKYYLENPEEREQIAQAGFNRVKKDHTLIDRMKKIIDIVESEN